MDIHIYSCSQIKLIEDSDILQLPEKVNKDFQVFNVLSFWCSYSLAMINKIVP